MNVVKLEIPLSNKIRLQYCYWISRLDNGLDVRMGSSWLNREGLCVLEAVRSCNNTVTTIISLRKLVKPVILRHLMQNYSDFYNGKLEESCALVCNRETWMRKYLSSAFTPTVRKLYAYSCLQLWLMLWMLAWTVYLFLPSTSAGRALWSSQTHSGWHFLHEVWWFLLMRFWWPGDFLLTFFFFLLYSISSQFEPSGVEVGRNTRLLQLQLRENEHLTEKVRLKWKTITALALDCGSSRH